MVKAAARGVALIGQAAAVTATSGLRRCALPAMGLSAADIVLGRLVADSPRRSAACAVCPPPVVSASEVALGQTALVRTDKLHKVVGAVHGDLIPNV